MGRRTAEGRQATRGRRALRVRFWEILLQGSPIRFAGKITTRLESPQRRVVTFLSNRIGDPRMGICSVAIRVGRKTQETPSPPVPPSLSPRTMQARTLSTTRAAWSRAPGFVALIYPSVAASKHNHPLFATRAFTSHDGGSSGRDGWGSGRSSWGGSWSSTGWGVALVGGVSQLALCDGKDEVKSRAQSSRLPLSLQKITQG